MKIQPQDLRNLICGTLKLIKPTDRRDRNKRVIWKAECICGAYEEGSRPELEKYAGHCDCPGHPFEGKEKPVEGFRLHPDDKEGLDHAEAAAAWELRRHPEQPEDEKDRLLSIKGSDILRDRLGLNGYRCETVSLTQSVSVLGCKAEKIIFAKSLTTDDRVFLHVQLVNESGKRSIVSSLKKLPESEWTMLSATLTEMQIVWRNREVKHRAVA